MNFYSLFQVFSGTALFSCLALMPASLWSMPEEVDEEISCLSQCAGHTQKRKASLSVLNGIELHQREDFLKQGNGDRVWGEQNTQLPVEIIHYVCNFLELKDVFSLDLVSKQFREGVAYAPHEHHVIIWDDKRARNILSSHLRVASLSFGYNVSNLSVETTTLLSNAVWITSLHFYKGVPDLSIFASYKNLRVLDLCDNDIGYGNAKVIASSQILSNLSSVGLPGNNIGKEGKNLLKIQFGNKVFF